MANETLTMTVTEALAKVKAWSTQIDGYWNVQGRMMFGLVAGEKQTSMISGYTTEDMKKKIQADVDGYDELVRKVFLLKQAIALSNSTTKVTIGNQTYTVADAVIMKNVIMPKKEAYLSVLRKAFTTTASKLDELTKADNKRIDELVGASMIITDASTPEVAAANAAKATALRNEQIRDTGPRLYDPKSLLAQIDKLAAEISDFKTNVDFTLSTNNATTTVSVTL